MFVDQDEADIEDIIGRCNYVALVNSCYNLPDGKQLPDSKPPSAPERVIEEVSKHMAAMPPDVPEFDHYAPAQFLVENTSDMINRFPALDEALSRFEKLFIELNPLLPFSA